MFRTRQPQRRISCRAMEVSTTTQPAASADADTVAVGLFEGEEPAGGTPEALRELLASGEARRSFKALALTHADGKRWLLVGLGARADFTPERARVAAAVACERAREISTRALCWESPPTASRRSRRRSWRARSSATTASSATSPPRARARHGGRRDAAAPRASDRVRAGGPRPCPSARRRSSRTAVNRARDLQNRPGNDLTPTALAEYAGELVADLPGLSVEVEGRDGITGRGMGAFAAVAQGSEQEPALITLRYEGPGAKGPTLGFVGKAVTFDSGGISLKPGAKMAEMKFDMSGGAAVIEAVAAIARLQLPVKLVAVVGATENLPSGRAVKPGDIVTASNGRTIEVNNTDAEGRLVLADCLCHAVREGAERIVDLATLTGAVIIALGSTYAG